tara:strand:- start:2517 stop:2681 length:165 start_codon:yes stop_codon:yes gene_type:complete
MLVVSTPAIKEVTGGVDILSPLGILILTMGILFTIGLPLTMILKGKKEETIHHD